MKKIFTKLFAALALLVFITPGLAGWGQTYTTVMECDMTTKAISVSAYNASNAYDDNWTIVNGANNNKGWAYFKMGGRSTTISSFNPCYIYSTTAASSSVDKITVHLPAGSLSKNGMSVNSWGVYVYSNSAMTTQIDYVAGGTITNSEGSFDFTPSTGVTWASGYYYKVSWNLANTTSTNGIVCVDKITLYKEAGGPIQLTAPTLTATPDNGKVTLEWAAVSNASSYTIQYADNSNFTGATTVTNATSPKEITGLTNGTTYYFKAMSVGDGTNYTSSDYGTAVSATPANIAKITITQNELTDFTNSYAWYDWSSGGVSGKAYAYKNGGMQFNSGQNGYWINNSSVIPGTITSVKMTKASGTDRTWTLKAGTSALTTTSSGTAIGNSQTVGTTGATWDVSGSYNYFLLYVSGGATVISSIEITYIPSTDPIIVASDPEEALAYNAAGGEFGYSITNPTSATLNAVSNADWITNVDVDGTNSKVTFSTSTNTGAQRQGTITLSYTGANDKVITITQNAAPAPSINAEDVNIAGDDTNGSIGYTISNPVSGGVLSANTEATWLTPGVVTNEAVPFTCTANQGASRSATVVLTYTYNTNQTVTKNVTVTQAAAPYSTIPALFSAATSTSKSVDVTFGDWVISGVNGSQAFLTDNQGNGLIIYQSNHGFGVNDVLSGTASCNLVKFNGSAELTGLTSETSGLSVSHNGTLTEQNIAINALTGVNTGAVLSYENLKYNGTAFEDAQENRIRPYNTFYSYSTPETNHYYNVKGVYLQYNSTKEILPRSAADIVLKAQMTAPTFNAFTYAVGGTPTAQTAAIAGTDFSGNLTVSVTEGQYVVSNDGSTYGASATFTQSSGTISSQTLYVKLNSGLSVGVYNGKLSFTANYLDAFEVNLAGSVTANPTYNVTLTQPAGDIATIASDPTYAQSGATITLSYSDVDACYVFDHWTVTPNVTWVTTNSFKMPGSDVEVSATFNIKHFTVNYSVNGIVYDDLVVPNIECGDDAELWTEEEMAIVGVEPPTGYTLAGWSTSASSSETVSSFTPSEDATLYAVLVPDGISAKYVKVTADLGSNWAGDYLIAYSANIFADGRVGGTGTGGIGKQYVNVDLSESISSDNSINSETGDDYCVTLEEISSGSNTYVLKTKDGQYNYYASNESNGLSSTTNKSTAANYPITVTFTSENDIRLCLGGDATGSVFRYNTGEYFRFYKNCSQSPVYLYKRTVPVAYTLVENITSTTASLPTIEPSYLITVKSGGILTLTGTNNGNASNLVIEDGGQLIHTTAAVKATLHKEVTGYGANPSVTTGWYTIASPVADLSASTVATTEDYDLFAYQESNFTWLNTQNHTLTFAEGQGFLYANSANQTLSYAGSMKATNAEVSIDLSYTAGAGALAGYNLVGNPFSRNLTSGEVKVGGSAITTYYVSEGGSNLTPRAIADYPIKPGQGFFVQATGTEQQIVFNQGSKDYASTNKPAFISIEASNSNFTDRAYVQLGGGNTLRKMSVNDNVHSLYVMQDGKDYASATIDSYNGSIPVCFKATETGRYTINIQTTGIDADYLHLIDRYTGADVDLLSEPSYTFIASKDDYESRFTLVFTADGSNNNNDIFAYQSGSDIVVNGNGELQIFDVTCRSVMTTTISGTELINLSAKGVYIFRLVGSEIKTQKIVVR